MGFAAVYRSSGVEELQEYGSEEESVLSERPEEPEDTVPHVRVKKTDNPTGEPQVETSLDLADPENLKYEVGEYDEKSGYYKVGTKLGDHFLSTPTLMTPEEGSG